MMRSLTVAAALAAVCFLAPARADAVSPACKLLTDAEAEQVLGHKTMMSDGGAETMGMSSCSWVDGESFNAVGLSVMGGEAFGGSTPDAAFEAQKSGLAAAGQGKVEDVPGVGDKAYLIDSSASGMNAISLNLLKGDKIVVVTGTGVPHDKIVEAAKLAAGHL